MGQTRGQREGLGAGHTQLACHCKDCGVYSESLERHSREVSLWFEWDYYKQQTTGDTLDTSEGAVGQPKLIVLGRKSVATMHALPLGYRGYSVLPTPG